LEPPEWARKAAGIGRTGAVGGSVLREGNEVKERMAKLMTKTSLHSSPRGAASPSSRSSAAASTIGGIDDEDVMAEVFRRDQEARESKERAKLEAEAAAVRAKMEEDKKREEEERMSAAQSDAVKRERLQKEIEVYEKSEEEMRADQARKKREKYAAEEQERERLKRERAEQRKKEERERPLTEKERKEKEKMEWLKSEKERKAREAKEKEEREEEERERQAREKREKALKEERDRDRQRRLEDSAALKVHEEKYAAFEIKAKAKIAVPFDDIPWPFCNDRLLLPTGGDTRKSIKVWSRRWHPDTWVKYEFPEGDRSKVLERVLEVSKDINAALAKYG